MNATAVALGEEIVVEPGSFRDRNSRVFYAHEGVYRGLSARAAVEWAALSASRLFKNFTSSGRLVRTEEAADDAISLQGFDEDQAWPVVLRHERIPFVSYPYEWCFGMLRDAALLQLDLMQAALDEDLILKDASAYNVQWRGSEPVFIDIPSLVRLPPGEPWAGYRQFCQLFLYPLMLQAYKGVPFQPWLRGQLDGIPPEQLNALMSVRDWLRPGVFLHVFLQAKLQGRHAGTHRDVRRDLRAAGFHKSLIQANVRRLRKIVQRLCWRPAGSEWSDYERDNSYSPDAEQRKKRFVHGVVASRHWNLVWDLGCNTGVYSRIAAENAGQVVALDADHLAVERLYQRLRAEKSRTILPLVCNLADPSPSLGWRGLERRDLPARGRPDLTLCLALIHHLVLGANIPLKELLEWLAGLGTDLVIEFVTREDPMVRALLRNREDQFADYDQAFFERSLADRFDTVRSEPISETRTLYHARR